VPKPETLRRELAGSATGLTERPLDGPARDAGRPTANHVSEPPAMPPPTSPTSDNLPLRPPGRERHVVVTFPVPDGALDALAAQLGPGHVVRDVREAGPAPDIVLCPSTSPQAIQRLSSEFPGAAVIVVEVEEWFGGPVTRAMNAGASGHPRCRRPPRPRLRRRHSRDAHRGRRCRRAGATGRAAGRVIVMRPLS
jgi:hypothetical protein